ncbi:MAG: hypothetical protein ACOVMN_11835 [Flexibacteraceae bacterium]
MAVLTSLGNNGKSPRKGQVPKRKVSDNALTSALKKGTHKQSANQVALEQLIESISKHVLVIDKELLNKVYLTLIRIIVSESLPMPTYFGVAENEFVYLKWGTAENLLMIELYEDGDVVILRSKDGANLGMTRTYNEFINDLATYVQLH